MHGNTAGVNEFTVSSFQDLTAKKHTTSTRQSLLIFFPLEMSIFSFSYNLVLVRISLHREKFFSLAFLFL